MLASNSGTEVGVVSNGELDGDDNSPVMIKTVQVWAQWAAGVIVVVGRRRGGGIGIIIRVTTRVNVGRHMRAPSRSAASTPHCSGDSPPTCGGSAGEP